jgi:hypothetical protein
LEIKTMQISQAQIQISLIPYNLIVDVYYEALNWENAVVVVEYNIHCLIIYESLRPYLSWGHCGYGKNIFD